MKSSLRLLSRDSRVRTVVVAAAASSVAALIGWSAARHTAVSPTAAPTALAPQAALTVLQTVPSHQPMLPALEAGDKILGGIPDDMPAAASGAGVNKADIEIARLKRAARDMPNDGKTWSQLGDALGQKGRQTIAPGYDDSAEKCYVRSLSTAPQNPDALLGIARVAAARREFAASLFWAKKALTGAPRLDAAYGLIGDASVATGDYDGAAHAYQTMLDIRPDGEAYTRAARFLYLTGDRRKAIWMVDKAVKIGGADPESAAWCQSQLADMYMDEGALLPAEQIVAAGLKKTPESYDLLAERGRVQEARGDLKGAIESHQKAIAVTPKHDALVALGDLYAATGETQKAEALYDRIEKAHEIRRAHGLTDELYMARFFADHDRQMPRALTIAQSHADTQNPAEADDVAWVFYKSGRIADAKTMIDRALSKGEPYASRLYHAGMIYTKLGDRFPAQEYLNRALSLDPHFSLRDMPIAVATLHDLGAKPRPIDISSPIAPAVAAVR